MSEFSSIVAIQINEAGQPTDLVAFSEGDTIASTVLNPETRDAITRVEDSSASWDAGLDAGTYNNIVDVSNNFQSFSGNIETSTRGLSSILDASVGSGLVDVCSYVTDNESTWNSGGSPSATGFENWNSTYNTVTTFSGDIEASTRNLSGILDGSTNFPNTLATNLEVSTRNLSGILDSSTNFPNTLATNLEVSTRNLSGILDSSTNFPNTLATNLEVSTRNLSAILDGSTNYPNTLATDLEVSTRNLSGILDGSTPLAAITDFGSGRIRLANAVVEIGQGKNIVNDTSNAGVSFNNNVLIASANTAVRFDGPTFVFEEDGDLYEQWSKNDFRNTKVVSGDVITSLRPFSGNIEASTRNLSSILDSSTNFPNTLATNLEVSTRNLSGILDGSTNYPNSYITTNEDDITETRTVRNVSSTAFLNGATPTLANSLDVNQQELNKVVNIFGLDGNDINFSAGQNVAIKARSQGPSNGNIDLSCNNIIIRQAAGTFSTNNFKASADAYRTAHDTVYDRSSTWESGGGGGGSFEGSAIASAIAIGNGSSVQISGTDNTAIDLPENNMVLVLDTADERFKYSKIRGPMVIDGAIAADQLATDAVTTDKIADGEITSAKLGSGAALGNTAANSITFSKLQLISAQTIVGNPEPTLGGPMQALTKAQARNILGVSAGTVAPPSPDEGDLWYDTTTGVDDLFAYDSGRSKWLSVSTRQYYFARNAAATTSHAHIGPGSLTYNSASRIGYLIPYDMTIVGYAWNQGTTAGETTDWTHRLQRYNLTTSANSTLLDITPADTYTRYVDMTLNTDFDANGLLGSNLVAGGSSTSVQHQTITVFMKRRTS